MRRPTVGKAGVSLQEPAWHSSRADVRIPRGLNGSRVARPAESARRLAGALAFVGALALPVAAARAAPFRVEAFAGSSNWPFWVAEAQGFFRREGLDASLTITPSSVAMAEDLQAGRYALALTSFDNVVAYDEGQGEAPLPGPAGFVALFGVDDGLLSLVVAPDIADVSALKGRTLSVDALTTGFAFVLRDLLARRGLGEGDVNLVKVGGGAQRLAALLKRDDDGTLLNTPLDLIAEASGSRALVRARDELGAYQGIVAVATRGAVVADRARLVAFARAFAAGVAWLDDPAHRDEAVALLASRMRIDRVVAARAYGVLTSPHGGIARDLAIDRAGVRTVLALRSRYAAQPRPLTDPERYIDDSVLREAAVRAPGP